MHKAVRISLWLGLIFLILVAWGFSLRQNAGNRTGEISIVFEGEKEPGFVSEKEIMEALGHSNTEAGGIPLGEININHLEWKVNSNPWVKKAEVFMDIDGNIRVKIWQKEALCRILNAAGESFYLDTEGNPMLWSPLYTPRVPLVTGKIPGTFAGVYGNTYASLPLADTASTKMLHDVYKFCNFIMRNPLWKAQVDQIFVNESGEFELIPRVGDHRIIFGDTTRMAQKFRKLEIFYREGLAFTGWNRYDTLNLKFYNQIVCTKIN